MEGNNEVTLEGKEPQVNSSFTLSPQRAFAGYARHRSVANQEPEEESNLNQGSKVKKNVHGLFGEC